MSVNPPPAPVAVSPLKPGYQTTEFYVTLLTTAAALLIALGVHVNLPDSTVQTLAGAAAIVVPAVYTLARTALKHAHG